VKFIFDSFETKKSCIKRVSLTFERKNKGVLNMYFEGRGTSDDLLIKMKITQNIIIF
jgi:hypothetical protein